MPAHASTTAADTPSPVDDNLARQARPGFGIPSQDPRPRAQLPMEPVEAQREARSVLVGGGVMAGAATGATIGVAVGGPAGVLVGATLGAVAGALGGEAAGSLMATATPARPTPRPRAPCACTSTTAAAAVARCC